MEEIYVKLSLAKFLKISVRTLDRIISRREIDYLKIAGQYRFSKDQVLKYMEKCTNKPKTKSRNWGCNRKNGIQITERRNTGTIKNSYI